MNDSDKIMQDYSGKPIAIIVVIVLGLILIIAGETRLMMYLIELIMK
jgi:hypothetical protein